MIKRLDHFVLTTNNLKKCLDFYTSIGFTASEHHGRHELRCGSFKINVHTAGKELSPHAGKVTPGSADFCLEVDGILDEILAKARRKGFPIVLEKTIKKGFYGEMTSIYLRDPDGNLVEFCTYSIN
ncbi:MAG: VOC family protein [Anaerolineaceae bacterium]|nr:VOC family protein [Anaerolineaceae bacterium]